MKHSAMIVPVPWPRCRRSEVFTDAEPAALALTEAVTRPSDREDPVAGALPR